VIVNGRSNSSPYTVTLNAGEIYFRQAVRGEGRAIAGEDLTGTQISSNFPVVVYGSHQRANIPWSEAVGRDHLVDQLPPTDRWATRAMLPPHFQLEKSVDDANFARVLAANNATRISIDSVFYRTINAGQFVDNP